MKHLKMMIRIAEAVAEESKCVKYHVGAVIWEEKTEHIVSVGYNGTPAGEPNCDEGIYADHHDWSLLHEIHAEVNAVVHADRDLHGCAMYCTLEPCVNCLKTIAAAGIKNVFFGEAHDCNAQVAKDLGIRLIKVGFIKL